jgi:hypothetical protein
MACWGRPATQDRLESPLGVYAVPQISSSCLARPDIRSVDHDDIMEPSNGLGKLKVCIRPITNPYSDNVISLFEERHSST